MTELIETVDLMTSSDYKGRFVAEYWQTKIRIEKLKLFCNKIEAYEMLPLTKRADCTWQPVHTCPLDLLKAQLGYMEAYLHTLELRAILENVDLNNR